MNVVAFEKSEIAAARRSAERIDPYVAVWWALSIGAVLSVWMLPVFMVVAIWRMI
jgi:hypothetical protein